MTRAEKILEAGMLTYMVSPVPDVQLLKAIAAMLVEATKPIPKRKKAQEKLGVSPRLVHERMNEHTQLDLSTYTTGSFGRLGKIINSINNFTEKDVEKLCDYFRAGNEQWYVSRGMVTWDWVVKNFAELIAKARAADQGLVEDVKDSFR